MIKYSIDDIINELETMEFVANLDVDGDVFFCKEYNFYSKIDLLIKMAKILKGE